jgi:hypothetical protein
MTDPAVPGGPASELADRVRSLRVRSDAFNLDRLLLIVGGVLLPLGLLLIVLAWLGASHTVLLFEQIPYMISGGILGLALVFIGGFVYFTYWQTLMVREGREHSRRVEDLLVHIEAHLSASGGGQAAPEVARLLATPTGTMLHRPSCQVVAGRKDLRRVALGTSGFEPCRICRPSDNPES